MKATTFTYLKSLFLGLLFFPVIGFGQPIEWEATFGGAADDYASQIQQTADEGYIIVGVTGSNNADVANNYGIVDGWVVKLDKEGVLEWEVNLGGSSFDELRGVDQTSDGGYVVVGETRSDNDLLNANNGGLDILVAKLDASGMLEWISNYGGAGFETARGILQTEDNGYIIAGSTDSDDQDVSANNGESDIWILKLNEFGIKLWDKSFGGSDDEEVFALDKTTDGGYILTGTSASVDGDLTGNNGSVDYWIFKLDSQGELEWQKNYGGEAWDAPRSIKQTFDGGYLVAGYSFSEGGDVSTPIGNADAWVLKLDGLGELEWEKSIGGGNNEFLGSIHQTADGKYLLAGGSYSKDGDLKGNRGSSDFWLTRINEQGEVVWGRNLGGTRYDEALSMIATADGGHILAGYTESENGDVSTSNGMMDMWIVKFMDLSTSVQAPILPEDIVLQPNPSQGDFTIVNNFAEGKLNIQVHSVLGHLLHTVESHQENVEIKGLSTGMYLISISNGETVVTKRMVIN